MTSITGVATSFIDFTRASNATVTDSDGKVKWAPSNLLTNSESFDASAWTKAAATVTANSIAAPNGTSTADSILDTAVNNIHYAGQSITAHSPAGLTFTVSAFLRANTLNFATLGISDISSGSLYAVAVFNLSTGAVATNGASGTGYSVVGTPTITSAGSSWYLCTVTVVAGTSASFLNAVIGANKTGVITASAGGFESYLGNGSGIYAWGAHLYRSDLGGMQPNTSAYPMYNPTTPKNLLGFTEDFSNAAWTKTGLVISANSTVSPNGLQTADTFTTDATTSVKSVQQSGTVASIPNTYSVYAKAGTHGYLQLFNGAGSTLYANFNLLTGALGTVGAGATATIDAAANGFYRCRITVTPGTNSNFRIGLVSGPTAAFSESWTTTGTETAYLWGAQLSDSASLDPYVPVYGAAVTSAAYYGPRRDFDPVTLACKGLLVEEQRANGITYSNVFDNAAWVKTIGGTGVNPVITAASAIAPDGTNTAYKVVFDKGAGTTTTDQSYIANTFTTSSNTTHSVWIRADSPTKISLRNPSNVGTFVEYDVTTSWQRIAFIGTVAPASSTQLGIGLRGTYSTVNSCTVYLWGAQVELGSFATSYIPTTTATATRNADVASVSTQAFPYSATEGTVVISTIPSVIGVYTAYSLNDGTTNNRVQSTLSSTQFHLLVNSGGAQQANINAGTPVAGAITKVSGAYKENDFAASMNGGAAVTDTSGTVPSGINILRIGARDASLEFLNGHIRQITYLPRRISNAELATRSA